jgi:hypothetical protein
MGQYISTTNYAAGAVVSFNGLGYTSLTSSNTGNIPSVSPSNWIPNASPVVTPTTLTPNHNYIGLNQFGDSICAGTGASTNFGFCSLIASTLNNIPTTNFAQSGDQAADMVFKVYTNTNPQASGNYANIVEILTNDAFHCGASTGCQNNAFHADMASLAWLAIPNTAKVLFGLQTSAMSTTGTWTVDSTLATNLALQTVVNGSTLTFTTLVPSRVVYLTWMAKDSDTASGALTCDSGAVTDTLNAFGYNSQTILTLNGKNSTPFTNRYVFSTSGTHTCTVTATASTGNAFSLVWASTGAPQGQTDYGLPTTNAPIVFSSGVLHEQGGTNDSTTVIYDTMAKTLAESLQEDGWQSYFVDTRSAVSATTDMSSTAVTLPNGCVIPASGNTPLHPSGGSVTCNGITAAMGGHANMAAAYLKAMQPSVSNLQNISIPGSVTLTGTTGTFTSKANIWNDNSIDAFNTTGPLAGLKNFGASGDTFLSYTGFEYDTLNSTYATTTNYGTSTEVSWKTCLTGYSAISTCTTRAWLDSSGNHTTTGTSKATTFISTLGQGTVTNTPATGVTSVTCNTATCDVNGGTYTVVGGTATTGTFVTLAWPTTTTAWRCTTNMNGGTSFIGIGHSVATATSMTVNAGVTISGVTFTFDYSCQP